jgi:hypothetical protein
MSATERGAPLSVAYKRASELTSSEVEASSTLSVNAVLVNPETQRHVGIEQQVSDSTTRHIGVLVAVQVLELNEHYARDQVDLKLSDSVRGTRRNSDEHVMKSK